MELGRIQRVLLRTSPMELPEPSKDSALWVCSKSLIAAIFSAPPSAACILWRRATPASSERAGPSRPSDTRKTAAARFRSFMWRSLDPRGQGVRDTFAGKGATMRRCLLLAFLAALGRPALAAGSEATLGSETRKFVRVGTPRVVLEHVRVIDGTGAAAVEDRNVTIENGKIAAISAGSDERSTEGTTVLDLRGYTVMPGIVGMHNHLFYLARPNAVADGSFDGPALFVPMTFSAPRLYLANGVTTMSTTGSVAPDTDLKLKRAIETGVVPGPHLDVS